MRTPSKPDPALWRQSDVRDLLHRRDIPGLYAALKQAGIPQRRIAALTGQAQSEVSEILKGRKVLAYDVLARIADGLGIPRGYLGMGFSSAARSPVEAPGGAAPTGEDEDMKRRNLLNLGSAAVVSAISARAGVPPELSVPQWTPEPTPLSRHLGQADVESLRAVSEALQRLARTCGGMSGPLIGEARTREAWLAGMEPKGATDVRDAYFVALAELYLGAGWAAHDEGLADTAHRCLVRAMELAQAGRDPVTACRAAYYLGVAISEGGEDGLNDGLKWLQLAEGRLITDSGSDPRAAALQGWIRVDTANLYAALGARDMARRGLVMAQDSWAQALAGPAQYRPGPDDQADFAWVQALAERKLGKSEAAMARLDGVAEHWATTGDRRQCALWRVTGAEIHLANRDRAGLGLAERAVQAVADLDSSHRARQMLAGLTRVLRAHGEPGRELARLAATVAGAAA